MRRLMRAARLWRRRQCVGCGQCARICPPTPSLCAKNLPRIDRRKCICCFCCQEFCPKGAMKARRTPVARALGGRAGAGGMTLPEAAFRAVKIFYLTSAAAFCYNIVASEFALQGERPWNRAWRPPICWIIYGALLTPKRREMLRMRYEEDMSLSEIGAQMGVSRQAVSDGMTAARKKLEEYEEKLGLVRRYLAITP